jgi:hypothetical protein
MDFVKGLDEAVVESASCKVFAALPDLRKAISELTVLKGVGPATASAVLTAYAPDVAPFMSDEVSSKNVCARADSGAISILMLRAWRGLLAGYGGGLGQRRGVHIEAVPCIR